MPRPSPAAPRRRPAAVLAAALAAVLSAGCAGGGPAELEARDAWIRPAAAGQTTAAYLVVEGGAADDRLLGGSFADAARVELHETVLEGDMARMVPRPEGLVVPAGGELVLAPRGAHLMLIDLRRDLAEGETVTMTLAFEGAGARTVEAEVTMDR